MRASLHHLHILAMAVLNPAWGRRRASKRVVAGVVAVAALTLFTASPRDADAAACPLEKTPLDHFDTPCEFGFGGWRVSDLFFFSLFGGGSADQVFVTPSGGTQRAQLQFDLGEPINAVAAGDFRQLLLRFEVERLLDTKIRSVALHVPPIFVAGPPSSAKALVEMKFCIDNRFDPETGGTQCMEPPGFEELVAERTGFGEGVDPSPFFTSPAVFVDTQTLITLSGGEELPGGARIDSIVMSFNASVPEPASLGLFGIFLAGLAFTRRRK